MEDDVRYVRDNRPNSGRFSTEDGKENGTYSVEDDRVNFIGTITSGNATISYNISIFNEGGYYINHQIHVADQELFNSLIKKLEIRAKGRIESVDPENPNT